MAAHGYEEQRFESVVNKLFKCPICLNVLRDPVMCSQNLHSFCRGCISRHLSVNETYDCPVCKQRLSLDTLSDPPRILTDYLSQLKIRCEFFQRGCTDFVELQHLETHLEACGYGPEVCSNDGCQLEVNRRDLIHHECKECEQRKLKCHSCDRISEDIVELKHNLAAINETLVHLVLTLDTLKRRLPPNEGNAEELRNRAPSTPKRCKIAIVAKGGKVPPAETDDEDYDTSYDSPSSQDSSPDTN